MLVDMDGVILDNTYDNNFWQNQIPGVISKNKNISFEDAKRLAVQIFNYKILIFIFLIFVTSIIYNLFYISLKRCHNC